MFRVLELMVFYVIGYFVIGGLGYGEVNGWLIMRMKMMIVMVICLLGIGGGVGGGELSLELVF